MDHDANFECARCGAEFRTDQSGVCPDCFGRMRAGDGEMVPIDEAQQMFAASTASDDRGDSEPQHSETDREEVGPDEHANTDRFRAVIVGVVVLLFVATASMGGLLYDERGRVDDLEAEVASVRADANEALRVVATFAGTNISELDRKLDDIEDAVFGFRSASSQVGSLADDVDVLAGQVDAVRRCVNDLISGLQFGSSFLSSCL